MFTIIWGFCFMIFLLALFCAGCYIVFLVFLPILKFGALITARSVHCIPLFAGGLILLALCGIGYALWAVVWFLWVAIALILGKAPPPFRWRPQASPGLPAIRKPALPALRSPRA